MNENKTCEQRIDDQMKRTIESMEYAVNPAVCADCGHVLLWDEYPAETCSECDSADLERDAAESDDTRQEWSEGVLSVDVVPVVTVLLSTGGPEDYFKVELDPETREPVAGWYHFKDWFDGARRRIDDDVLDLLSQLVYFGR